MHTDTNNKGISRGNYIYHGMSHMHQPIFQTMKKRFYFQLEIVIWPIHSTSSVFFVLQNMSPVLTKYTPTFRVQRNLTHLDMLQEGYHSQTKPDRHTIQGHICPYPSPICRIRNVPNYNLSIIHSMYPAT